jgi:hypothetical protein
MTYVPNTDPKYVTDLEGALLLAVAALFFLRFGREPDEDEVLALAAEYLNAAAEVSA